MGDGATRPFRARLDQARRAAGVAHDAVLKDYALSYLLAGIQSVPELDQTLAFKGGTALRKCFFEGYRFSEDLDFTLLEPIEDLEPLVRRATEGAVHRMSEYGPFSAEVKPASHRAEHPFGQQDFRITVKYPTGASLPLKVEITREEPIVVGTERRSVLHAFPEEDLQVSVNCYRIEEIVIEKLRHSCRLARISEGVIGSTVPATCTTSGRCDSDRTPTSTGARSGPSWIRNARPEA